MSEDAKEVPCWGGPLDGRSVTLKPGQYDLYVSEASAPKWGFTPKVSHHHYQLYVDDRRGAFLRYAGIRKG